jgi:hypothetical protein
MDPRKVMPLRFRMVSSLLRLVRREERLSRQETMMLLWLNRVLIRMYMMNCKYLWLGRLCDGRTLLMNLYSCQHNTST